MRTITYNLRLSKENSVDYYKKIDGLGNQLTELMSSLLESWGRQIYVFNQGQQFMPKVEEYEIALLWYAILHKWYWEQEIGVYVAYNRITLTELHETLNYLEKSNEFEEEIYYFNVWLKYLKTIDNNEWQNLWKSVEKITQWIEIMGEKELKQYLPCVESYRN